MQIDIDSFMVIKNIILTWFLNPELEQAGQHQFLITYHRRWF